MTRRLRTPVAHAMSVRPVLVGFGSARSSASHGLARRQPSIHETDPNFPPRAITRDWALAPEELTWPAAAARPAHPRANPVERRWACLRIHDLANRVFDDDQHLLDAGAEAWRQLNPELLQCPAAPAANSRVRRWGDPHPQAQLDSAPKRPSSGEVYTRRTCDGRMMLMCHAHSRHLLADLSSARAESDSRHTPPLGGSPATSAGDDARKAHQRRRAGCGHDAEVVEGDVGGTKGRRTDVGRVRGREDAGQTHADDR